MATDPAQEFYERTLRAGGPDGDHAAVHKIGAVHHVAAPGTHLALSVDPNLGGSTVVQQAVLSDAMHKAAKDPTFLKNLLADPEGWINAQYGLTGTPNEFVANTIEGMLDTSHQTAILNWQMINNRVQMISSNFPDQVKGLMCGCGCG